MVTYKSKDEIEILREGGKILGKILRRIAKEAKPGVKTSDLDALADELMRASGGRSAFKGYRPEGANRAYPAATCISVNEVIVHGLPGPYVLKSGDIVKLDMGLIYRDLYTDSAVTVGVGAISKQ